MSCYRIHFVGRMVDPAPAQFVHASDDRGPVKSARLLLDREDIQVWDDDRLVATLEHDRPWERRDVWRVPPAWCALAACGTRFIPTQVSNLKRQIHRPELHPSMGGAENLRRQAQRALRLARDLRPADDSASEALAATLLARSQRVEQTFLLPRNRPSIERHSG
jgi:hypothetical protein